MTENKMIKALHVPPNNFKEITAAITNISEDRLNPSEWHIAKSAEVDLIKGFAYLLTGKTKKAAGYIKPESEYKLYHTNIVDLSKHIPEALKKLNETADKEDGNLIKDMLKEIEIQAPKSISAMKLKYAIMEASMRSLIKEQNLD